MEYETAVSNFGRLLSQYSDCTEARDKMTEAQVRFELLDLILEDVLGWNKSVIVVEHRYDGSYTDYELGKPQKRVIVEAKRPSIGFELPTGLKNIQLKLETVRELNPEVTAALEQVAQYCQTRGVAIGVISNGFQFVVFLASRQDGVPVWKGSCLVFSSLSTIAENFQQFWDALSPEGVKEEKISSMLCGGAVIPPPPKLSQSLFNYPGRKNRNSAAADLEILGSFILDDMIREKNVEGEFLREAYCQSGALSKYALVSREVIRSRYLALEEVVAQIEPASGKKQISRDLKKQISAASLSKKPILLVGDVGVGKTMFIRHLIKVEAKELFEKSFVLMFDFGEKPALVEDLTRFVKDSAKSQLEETYKIQPDSKSFLEKVYKVELQRFDEGLYGQLKDIDPTTYTCKRIELLEMKCQADEHLKRVLEYVSKEYRKTIVIFFDNVDQRPLDFQDQVFMIAIAVAASWPVSAFVSLRPETFFSFQEGRSLIGLSIKSFYYRSTAC